MKLRHNSRSCDCRAPFGAVRAGTTVRLAVHVEDADFASIRLSLRTWVDGRGERIDDMPAVGNGTFEVSLACPEPEIVWYLFIARAADGTATYLGAPTGRTGGEGVAYASIDAPSFQITVFQHRAIRPTWYEHGIVYQIFPDRYRRDAGWRERTAAVLDRPRAGIARRLVEDWNEPPSYRRANDGSIACWDFYGGSLKGIEDDLQRLAELGVSAIYLNPIFEAASNHRYDTADYLSIDPILGTEKDFRHLCAAARERGISIILDGVFNHTGDDSIYFNRYGNYPGAGAWSGPESPWRDAYKFDDDGGYRCWWGVKNMPDLNQDSPLVRELILGADGVVRHWLRAGARGWRLDVADELSDGFIADIKRAVMEERPDGLVLGEVWEDASNKSSYGKLRRYLLGQELDSAMNYPFRSMVIDYLLGVRSARDTAETIESLRENYPPEALACALNLLGSHDKPRIASVLGGGPDESQLPESERGTWRLDPHAMGLAKGRFWLASLMQMTFPGVPSIYYGDEYGLEGLSDPGNRRTLPDERDVFDHDMLTIVRNAAALRRALPLMVTGDISAEARSDDVLSYTRRDASGLSATVILNSDCASQHAVSIPMLGQAASDLISGRELGRNEDGTVTVELAPLGSAVVHFHDRRRMQKPLAPGAGIMCHLTSMPTEDGRAGRLGAAARRFIDRLHAMGARYWQVLPVNPTDGFNSPYAGPSAFAGSSALLPGTAGEIERDFESWRDTGGEHDAAFLEFAQTQAAWLAPYCAFMAIKRHMGGASRHEWPARFKRYDPSLLDDGDLAREARFQAYLQFCFETAWGEMSAYAHERGIEIIGDIPMYVSDESADVWSAPELFNLDDDGRPTEVAGAPPDDFAPDGQLWGNPTFRWDRMRHDGFTWWLARLRRAQRLYDHVRLDHFLGYHSYFSIPAGGACSAGRWLPGPGADLFQLAYDAWGPLPFIAEDLGYLTPGVRALCATCGFPGMDVMQFEDYDVRAGFYPQAGKICYTSTHDTSTLIGFCERSYANGDREQARRIAEALLGAALHSDADVVITPLQDILELDDQARMNVPGVAEGNWTWRAREADVIDAVPRIREMLERSGRISAASR
ncbi:4-alpha-glucanotransferase [Coriobacterium glomerans PW2]|uniref:4-alpha-glucanotransferase n=1 Tax=Coriobacterium glomerans (strain ATCC 49209 / DSM 20642 / JCM 10262 / PW2) TaxID=700015 RepID=F2N9S9_CORGP|nr:4-alpha-glucanotransferase [Coriobacterium glomerans]AEB07182.1 4-alpha-glucanotransferase [Coriobacterium glomerans PW2]